MGAAAADHQLQSPGPSGAAWVPHGRLLTACLVALNAFLVLLVYVYFWRFFSRREEEDAASSSEEASPPPSPKARDRHEVDRAIAALPVFVHSSDSSKGGGASAAAAECVICIAEFAVGEEGRLLPRCGHRFHARCVDTWFRFHTTCPLCRDTVLHVAGDDPMATVAVTTTNRSTDTDADCPV